MQISEYIRIVNQRYQAGNATEHSYRGDLQQLLQSLLPDVDITNEPKRIECGAPDYILSRKNIPVGYIEAKDVGVELGHKAHKDQFDRYKAALDNLIITDYLQFHFYKQGQLVASCFIGELSNGKVHANPQNFDAFTSLIQNFALTHTASIKSPVKLAQMMASKAKLMADVIHKSLNEDDKNKTQSELKNQFNAFKTVLMHDINNAEFADIYAQTIAYGMFAARYHDPTLQNFSREEAARLIPQSNPFLRQLFRTVAGYNLDDADGQRLLWIVEELVQIFLATDVATIMRNFGKATRQQDPVVHFYETFLAEYDPKLRKARGVWYTPEPVVNFIVRAVDDILKTKFKLPDGLGDTSKTQIKVEVKGVGKKGETVNVEKEIHKVQILDPATGTGTFLAQTVRHIYSNQFANMQGAWPQYVKEHLIPRLNGFELLMTSYAMAHLKLDMLLTETGYVNDSAADRLRIYLTNSLENDDAPDLPLFNFLSAEANEANRIKRDAPVMVVMGNPPYSVSSSNKSKWIQDLLVDYKKDLNERNIQPLSDDYIKFIRFGQHFIDKNGEGVLAYISNNSFIDGLIHRQMRKSLLESFDEIYILDLHGNAKKKETAPDGSKDENVFDIMQGVSINLFVKHNPFRPEPVEGQATLRAVNPTPTTVIPAQAGIQSGLSTANISNSAQPETRLDSRLRGNDEVGNKQLAKVFHHSLYGKREAKYEALNAGAIASLPWQQLEVKAPEYFFAVKDFKSILEYENGFKINELFPINNSGIQTKRDAIFVNLDEQKLINIVDRLLAGTLTKIEETDLNVENSSSYKLLDKIKKVKFSNSFVNKYSYRPFDDRKIYYDKDLIGRSFYSTMQHLKNDNLGLLVPRQCADDWHYIFISNKLVDINLTGNAGAFGASNVFPLYTYPKTNDLLAETTRTPNLNMQIVEAIAQGLGLSFTAEKSSTVIPAYDFASALALSKSEYPGGAKAGIHVDLKENQKMDSRFRGNDEVVESEQTEFAPIDLLDYIYAVLHSPSYRETYKEFLKIDFPRVPYPKNAATFWQLVALGSELRKTHLLEVPTSSTRMDTGLQADAVKYPIGGNNVVDKPTFTPSPLAPLPEGEGNKLGRVYINETQYFENVPEISWSFYIGGYQPAQKWLKDRKGRTLSHEDIAHYQKIIAALTKTHELMQAVDVVFEAN
jgi:predicted helicase